MRGALGRAAWRADQQRSRSARAAASVGEERRCGRDADGAERLLLRVCPRSRQSWAGGMSKKSTRPVSRAYSAPTTTRRPSAIRLARMALPRQKLVGRRADVGPCGRVDRVRVLTGAAYDVGDRWGDTIDDVMHVRGEIGRSSREHVDCRLHGPAERVPHHDDQLGPEGASGELDAAHDGRSHDVARHADDEQVTEAAVEDELGGTRESEHESTVANGACPATSESRRYWLASASMLRTFCTKRSLPARSFASASSC